MQSQLIAGETFNYSAAPAQYPVADGWALGLYLNPRAGGTVIIVNSVASGSEHLLQVSDTSVWAPGLYGWELWATKAGERYRLDAGQLQVQPSLMSAAAGLDTRSDAQRALDALRAAWRAYIDSGNFVVQQYTINGRTMTYRSVSELRAAINAAERDVAGERASARVAQGLSPRNRFVVRM